MSREPKPRQPRAPQAQNPRAPQAQNPRAPQARREKDTAEKALADLANLALSKHFADPAAVKRYRAFLRRPKRNRDDDRSTDLREWRILELGLLSLHALPEPMEFLVSAYHPSAQADVIVHYDIDRREMFDVTVESIEGSRRVLRQLVRDWIADDGDEGDPEDSQGTLFDLLSMLPGGTRLVPDQPADAPTDPLLPRESDAKRVRAIAAQRAVRGAGKPSLTHDEGIDWITSHPHVLSPLLDQYVAACNAPNRDDKLVAAYAELLTAVLEFIRLRHEAGYAWALPMLESYSGRVAALGRDQALPQVDWFQLTSIMALAKIPLTSHEREVLADAGFGHARPDMPDTLRQMLRGLLDEMAQAISTPFELIEGLNDSASVMPFGVGSFLAYELGLSRHPLLREAVALLLLDPEPEVRRSAVGVLKQTASPDTLAPVTLRRAIAVRNWLPEAERPALDEAIRAARVKGIESAHWPAPQQAGFLASVVDGAGAQSVIATSTGKGKGLLSGMLIKLGAGVTDAWCDTAASRREINTVVKVTKRDMNGIAVSRDYLDVAIPHAIASGLSQGKVPHVSLLDIAENIGTFDWKDRGLDVAAEAARLFEAMPASAREPDAIEVSLARSGRWMQESFAESWYEDNPNVRNAFAANRKAGKAKRIAALLNEGMAQTRAGWTERFVLMALRAQAAIDAREAARAADCIVLAWALAGDRPLGEIPLMIEVARRTDEVGIAERW